MQTPPDLQGLSIGLLANDDALRGAVRMLLLVSGFHVREYRSADEYLSLPAKDTHQCMVVDCSLPDMSGRLCERILKSERIPSLVAITASPEELRPWLAARSTTRVLRKPFEGQRLIDAIRETLDATASKRPPESDSPEARDTGA